MRSSVLAIARLTFREGVRMRIVIIFLIVLGFLVLRLPFAVRGDDTLTGRLRNFLDWSLMISGFLLSLSTVFIAASTVATDLKRNTMHLVVTKPVSKLQVILGKWLGVMLLNVLLVTLCGGSIYLFARFIAHEPRSAERIDDKPVESVVWTARALATPTRPDMRERAEQEVDAAIERGELNPSSRNTAIQEQMIELDADWRTLGPRESEVYFFEDIPEPSERDIIVEVRVKPRRTPASLDNMVTLGWQIVDPDTGEPLTPVFRETFNASTFQNLPIPTRGEFIVDGRLALVVFNPEFPSVTPTMVKFEDKESLQVLYRVASFEQNLARALGLMLLQLTFLSALGVFFSTFVSFPVACFCGLAWYFICVMRGFLLEAIGSTNVPYAPEDDPLSVLGPYLRPVLSNLLTWLFPDFGEMSGINRLIDGVYIDNASVLWAAFRTLAVGAVPLLLAGWLVFREREVAEVVV